MIERGEKFHDWLDALKKEEKEKGISDS